MVNKNVSSKKTEQKNAGNIFAINILPQYNEEMTSKCKK